MTEYLRVAGQLLSIRDGTGYEETPDIKGNTVAVDDNTLQSSERSPKRKFSCVAKFDPPSSYDTFLALISSDPGIPTPVAVVSDTDGLTRGAALNMWVRAGRIQYITKGSGINKTTTVSVPLSFREA